MKSDAIDRLKRELERLDVARDAAHLNRLHAEHVERLARAGIGAKQRGAWDIYVRSARLHDCKVLGIEYVESVVLNVQCDMGNGRVKTLQFAAARIEGMIVPARFECVLSSVTLLAGGSRWRTLITLRAGGQFGGIMVSHRAAPRSTLGRQVTAS